MKNASLLVMFSMIMTLLVPAMAISGDDTAVTGMSKEDRDKQEMMVLWEKFSKPGENHKRLEYYVGEWDADVKMWMDPQSPANESKGTAQAELILGGRYLQMKYKGVFMGTPFDGMVIVGYNNHKKVYQSMWLDSMSTAFYLMEGTCEDDKNCTDTAIWDDPIRNVKMDARQITTIMDENTYKTQMFEKIHGDDTKKEFKSMEIVYSRRK